jgi:uncharacterized protein YbjT (DUF2867 family)
MSHGGHTFFDADTFMKALLSEGANVVVVTRPESSSAKSLPSGVKAVSAGFKDVPALVAIFKEHDIEVVASTVSVKAVADQKFIADAAKQAGVKLFLPSEYGPPTIGMTEGEFGLKANVGEYVKAIGLPYVRIFVSCLVPNYMYRTD